jgi:NNP family nitrate/nitrite transporter-like MFS transporter
VATSAGNSKVILFVRHTWVFSLLYIGTFGSFIEFSLALGRVLARIGNESVSR